MIFTAENNCLALAGKTICVAAAPRQPSRRQVQPWCSPWTRHGQAPTPTRPDPAAHRVYFLLYTLQKLPFQG